MPKDKEAYGKVIPGTSITRLAQARPRGHIPLAARALPGLDHRPASCYLCAARAWRRFLPRHIL